MYPSQVGLGLNIIFPHQLLLLLILRLKCRRTIYQSVSKTSISVNFSQLGGDLHFHMSLILRSAQLVQMHLIWPIRDPQRPLMRPHPREREVLRDTGRAVGLDRTIYHAQRHAWDEHLRLCNHAHCALRVGAIDLVGRLQHQ